MQSESDEQKHAPEGYLGRSVPFCSFRCAQVLPDFQSGHLFDLQISEHRSLIRQICTDKPMYVSCRGDENRQSGQNEGCAKRAEDH